MQCPCASSGDRNSRTKLSIFLRSAFTLTLAGVIVGLWVPSEAQEIEGPRPRSPAPQGQNGTPPAADVDDPYGPPPLVAPGNSPDEDVTEPVNPNINTTPADSSISNQEQATNNVVPAAHAIALPPAPKPELMRFEEDTETGTPFETMEEQREQAEALAEVANIPTVLPPPESLPALSIIPAFRLGPMTAALGLRYQGLYDNNILLAPNNQQGDFEHIIAPRLSLSLGDAGLGYTTLADTALEIPIQQKPNFLELDYNPQFLFFQHYRQYNAFEQQLKLNAQYVLARTILRQSLSYNDSTDPDREIQGRLSRQVFASDTDATYQASERIAYELDATALVRNFEQEINSDEGRLRFTPRYAVNPDWTVSVSVAGGELFPEQGTSQVYEQAMLGTQNQIGTDLNVYLSAGADFREPENTGQVQTTPLFTAFIRYAPSTETQVVISAIRQIFSSSDVVDQDFTSSRVTVTATQRLWQTYNVDLEVGYENADYYQFGKQTSAPRSDNYPTAKVEFSYARFEDLQAGIFYQVRRNFSNDPSSSFSDQQVGVEFRIGN